MATSLSTVPQSRQWATPRSLTASQGYSPCGASSETGELKDVLLSRPAHLTMIPCNSVAIQSIGRGLVTCPSQAALQHDAFAARLGEMGVRCHFVPPREDLTDLCFTRDAVLASPWGLIQLRPRASHRQAEACYVTSAAQKLGFPLHARIMDGTVEGGDVCLVCDGLVIIGYSNERTDLMGAEALGSLFSKEGWEVIYTSFDPHFLHLDTIITTVADDCAVVFPGAVDDAVLRRLSQLEVKLIPVTADEVRTLSGNCLSLGRGRVMISQGSNRLATLLEQRGLRVIRVAIDQFTRCGGGPHCLTLPLARRPH